MGTKFCAHTVIAASNAIAIAVKSFRILSVQLGHSIWQRNYWERVIRNEAEYARIAEYVCDNPVLWGEGCLGEILV
jgi:REP element-mobilizing transposase RayT